MKISTVLQALFYLVLLVALVFGLPKVLSIAHDAFFARLNAIHPLRLPHKQNIQAGSIYIGNDFVGSCENGSWMIRVQASNTKKVLLLEGDPNVGLIANWHNAPSAFYSSCFYVRVIPSGYGEADWKVSIFR